jgi:methionyl-tRNA formyltransferase
MKKFTIIGLAVVAIVACILLLWQHAKTSRDRNISQKLAGAWSWEFANIRETSNFAADGSFTAQEVFSHSKSTNTYQMAGTWYIKDGKVIETITSDSNKKARVPRTNSGQIVSIDAHEYVVAFDTNKLVLNRVTP